MVKAIATLHGQLYVKELLLADMAIAAGIAELTEIESQLRDALAVTQNKLFALRYPDVGGQDHGY